MDDILIDDI